MFSLDRRTLENLELKVWAPTLVPVHCVELLDLGL